MRRHTKGDLEIDQLGRLILAAILLLILIVIIGVVISGEFTNQFEKMKELISFF